MSKSQNYATYTEAKNAVKTLGITNTADYRERCNEDSRLVKDPGKKYKHSGWVGWHDFLGKVKLENQYETYSEAKAAAQLLGAKSAKDYMKSYKEDSRLWRNPSLIFKYSGWVDWYEFLGNTKPQSKYETYAEAKNAAQILGIIDSPNYKERYKEDPLLPSSPKIKYKNSGWTNWSDFLGTLTKYKTYAEAQTAAQALGIISGRDYVERYKEDPRLTATPHKKYRNSGWVGWPNYLGHIVKYETYAEAQTVVQALGIISREHYHERYKEDPGLHSSPDKKYENSGWVDWYDYLGLVVNYKTFAEAKAAVQALGIIGKDTYKDRYKEDPLLPSAPNRKYEHSGWVDWYDLLANSYPLQDLVEKLQRKNITTQLQYV